MFGSSRPGLALTILVVLTAGEGLAQSRPQPPAAIPGGQAPPVPSSSRGENFSAGKSPAQLFASDCTGAGCHRGPQGLAKDRGQLGLASFLREHYTNSRESAAALAGYLASARQQAQPDQPGARPPRAAARPDDPSRPAEEVPPRSRRATAAPTAPGEPGVTGTPGDIAQPEPGRAAPQPASPPARADRRTRQQATAAPPAAVEAAPPPPPPPPPPPKREDFDIFD